MSGLMKLSIRARLMLLVALVTVGVAGLDEMQAATQRSNLDLESIRAAARQLADLAGELEGSMALV